MRFLNAVFKCGLKTRNEKPFRAAQIIARLSKELPRAWCVRQRNSETLFD
jgi:hypothetical protein